MLIYYLLLVLLLFSIPLSYINRTTEKSILIAWGIILTLFAGIREIGVDRDSYNYLFMFNYFESYFDALKFGVEPGISVFTTTLKLLGLGTIYGLFAVFAFVSVPIKIRAIAKYSPLPILSILIYYVFMYFKQDFTAIRAAAAIGIFCWAIDDIFSHNRKRYFLKILFACCFHFSAVFYFPLYFINLNQFPAKKYLFALLSIFILSNIHVFDIITKLPVLSSISKVQQYSDKVSNGVVEQFNPHGLLFIFNLIIIVTIICFSKTIIEQDKRAIFFIKCVVIGNILNYIFGPLSATLGSRISDLYLLLMCITYSYFIYVVRPYVIGVIISIFIALILFWFNMSYTNIVYDYHTWMF